MKRAHIIIKAFELAVVISLIISTLCFILILTKGAPRNTLNGYEINECQVIAKEIYYNQNYNIMDVYSGYIVEIGSSPDIIKVSRPDLNREDKIVCIFKNNTMDVKREIDYNMRFKHVLNDAISIFFVCVNALTVSLVINQYMDKDDDVVTERNINEKE